MGNKRRSIFDIQDDFIRLENAYYDIEDIEDEEQQAEAIAKLEREMVMNEEDFIKKMKGYGYLIATLKSETTLLGDEMSRLGKLKSSKSNLIDRLKLVMRDALLRMGNDGKSGNKVLDLVDMKFYTRKNEVVLITDEEKFINTNSNNDYINANIGVRVTKGLTHKVLEAIGDLTDNEVKYTYAINRVGLKKDLKDAVEVEGASLIRNDSLIMK